MMDEQTRAEWDALRKKFDKRNEEIVAKYEEIINTIEDRHRADERGREDRKVAFLHKLKTEHRESVDIYIKCRREAQQQLRNRKKEIEQERQAAYSEFKKTHNWGGEESTETNNNLNL